MVKSKEKIAVKVKINEMTPSPFGLSADCPVCGKENLLICGWVLKAIAAVACQHLVIHENGDVDICDCVDGDGTIYAEVNFVKEGD